MAIRPFNAPLTQRFGVKNSAYRLGYHPGDDYGTRSNTPVKAPEAGYNTWLWSNTYGYVAALILKNGDVLWFAHNSKKGKTGNVKKGEVIAYTGNTGWSTGPHSHVEHRIKGNQNQPRSFETWLRNNPEPKPVPPKPKFNMPDVNQSIVLTKGVNRTTFKAGTTQEAGTIKPKDSTTYVYVVRGYDKKYPNRIIINSKSAGGDGVALALYYTNGKKIDGWRIK